MPEGLAKPRQSAPLDFEQQSSDDGVHPRRHADGSIVACRLRGSRLRNHSDSGLYSHEGGICPLSHMWRTAMYKSRCSSLGSHR